MVSLAFAITVMNYFKLLHIGSVSLMLQCTDEATKVKIMKEFSNAGFRTSFSMLTINEEVDFKSGAVLELACEKSTLILKEMSKRKLFSIDREWLLIEEVNDTMKLEETTSTEDYEKISALPGSRVTLAQVSKGEEQVAFYDMYRIAMWTKMKYYLICRQRVNSSSQIPARPERTNFDGVTLRSGTAVILPKEFDGFWKIDANEADGYAKAVIYVMYLAAEHLNFGLTLLMEDKYGYPDKDGNFSGLMGRVQREEIEVGAVGAMMRPERMKIAEFTGDLFVIRSPIIFKQPSLTTTTNIFLLPFTESVWIVCCTSAAMAGLILYISYYLGNKINKISIKNDISASEVMTTILGCICQQGPPPVRGVPGGRIILFLFELCVFSLFVAYSAKIVALLQSSTHTIKTLSDLANSPLKVGIQDLFYNKLYFKESDINEIEELYQKKIKPNPEDEIYMKPEIGLSKVKSGMFAYKCETNWMYQIISDTYDESEKCGLSELEVFLLQMVSLPVPKRSGIREHITRSVARQREVGLLQRSIQTIFPKKPECNLNARFTEVSLIDFKPALQTIYWGLVSSFAVFCLEITAKIRKSILKTLKNRIQKLDGHKKWV